MNKPFAFYASIISGSFLLASALTMLGFSIYFIVIQVLEGFFPLAFCSVICGYFGITLILYGIKFNKAINMVSTILELYPDFERTASYDIHTQSNKKSSLLVDTKNKRFIFVLFDHLVPMYSFSDFMGYEVYENDVKLFSTSRDNPSILDRNLGSAGARGGNIFTDRVFSLQLIINLKDELNPQLVINFLARGVDRLSPDYREYIGSLNRFCVKLDRLLQS